VIYSGEGTGAYTTNLEVGVVIEIDEVGVSLGKFGKGSGLFKLLFEFVFPLLSMVVESPMMSHPPSMSSGGVMIIMDEATMMGNYFLMSR